MPVPSSINDLNTTPGLNSPAGSESPATFDDYMRTFAAFIAQLRDGKASTTDAVLLTGNQTIAGVKTFSSTIVGNLNGNASTATTATSAGTVTGSVDGANITDNTVTPAKLTQKFTVGAAIPTTSGANIDINGVFPSWARHIRLAHVGVSTNGTDPLRYQLGDSGGIENTGYASNGLLAASGSAAAYAASTAGFDTGNPAAATFALNGIVEFISSDGLTWVCVGNLGNPNDGRFTVFGGFKTLSAALDRIRLTTQGGTNTFDAGSILPSWQ